MIRQRGLRIMVVPCLSLSLFGVAFAPAVSAHNGTGILIKLFRSDKDAKLPIKPQAQQTEMPVYAIKPI